MTDGKIFVYNCAQVFVEFLPKDYCYLSNLSEGDEVRIGPANLLF